MRHLWISTFNKHKSELGLIKFVLFLNFLLTVHWVSNNVINTQYNTCEHTQHKVNSQHSKIYYLRLCFCCKLFALWSLKSSAVGTSCSVPLA